MFSIEILKYGFTGLILAFAYLFFRLFYLQMKSQITPKEFSKKVLFFFGITVILLIFTNFGIYNEQKWNSQNNSISLTKVRDSLVEELRICNGSSKGLISQQQKIDAINKKNDSLKICIDLLNSEFEKNEKVLNDNIISNVTFEVLREFQWTT
jgi:hypothetical protein